MLGTGEGHADMPACFRMCGQHVLQQVLRVIQAGGQRSGRARRLPQRQVVVEQGQRTGIEGHEQPEAGHQADPGVQGGERAQVLRAELHAIDLIARRRPCAAARAHRNRPPRCRPGPARHIPRGGN
ncbi:hypothetical protein G6F60_014742 [Rhizopus arrhizus]|nr:hypothetical protein G6F60_014742 [Rhizopus arrhizus]